MLDCWVSLGIVFAVHCNRTLSLRTSAHTGVAIRFPRPPKAPLADQGWCSAQRIKIEMIASGNHTIICAAPVRTLGLRGSELPSFRALSTIALLQSLSQKSKIFASSLYTRELGVLPHQCIIRNSPHSKNQVHPISDAPDFLISAVFPG